jgi:DNA end-binding protein Ku
MQVLKERLQARGDEEQQRDSGDDRARASRASSTKTRNRANGTHSARKPFRQMSRDELYARARDEGIAGRSTMKKEELIKALEQV